jgi:hypothetical protein
MKDLLKYLFFLVIGITIFILYNNVDNFTIGGIGWAVLKEGRQENSTNRLDYDFYYNPSYNRDNIVQEFNRQIFIYDDLPDTGRTIFPIQYDTIDNQNFGIQNFHYYQGRNFGFPSQIMTPNVPGLGIGSLGFVDQPPGGGGMSGGGIGSSLVRTVSGLLYSESENECASRQKRRRTCSNVNGVTRSTLERFRYIFNIVYTIVEDGITYNLYEVDFSNVDDSLRDNIENEFEEVDDHNPEYAILPRPDTDKPSDTEYKLYYLTKVNGSNEVIVSRCMIAKYMKDSKNIVELDEFVACVIGKGYGTLLMKCLAHYSCSNRNIQITHFYPMEGTYRAYRNLFKLSVTSFKDICSDRMFTIFKPDKALLEENYQMDLSIDSLNQFQYDNYLLFLMKYHDELLLYFLHKKEYSEKMIKEILDDKYEMELENMEIFNNLLFNLDDSNLLKERILRNIDNPEAIADIFKEYFDTL